MGRPTALARVVALAISTVYSVVLFVLGVELPGWWRPFVSFLPALVVAGLVAWDLWIWRWPVVQQLVRRPDLRGLWRVSMTPHADSDIPKGGNRGPIPAFLEIKQSFWSIHLRLYSEQSGSRSTATSWLPSYESSVDYLTFTYDNKPKVSESHRSMRSSGACNLTPTSLRPEEVEGTYFTDRFTKGDMNLVLVDRTSGYPSFTAASKYADSKGGGV
ncbi:hypothetical protein [Promicromonospora iranensis]|uniref:CD-NTase-associated protein 15 domain-containing protein n=1 Tax=Promicromonospora iranensis TaxID=1105144 RepID=A0ABU2CK62_9MICO|nr:hypothetical protein [Promicromonospora iranensis]MDR7381726.1 hypothetical protein [Promicromonospora iranensis]